MTNREVYIEVESIAAKYYPEYMGSNLLYDVRHIVGVVQFELNMPEGMAVQYVRNAFAAYRPKVEV